MSALILPKSRPDRSPLCNQAVLEASQSVADFITFPDKGLEVADFLVGSGSFCINIGRPRREWYTWRSGIIAPCYCDCRVLYRHPEVQTRVSAALAKSVRAAFPRVELIVGIATAGISWAYAVATALRLPLAYVRTREKEYGLGGLVECSPPEFKAAVIIDDLVASGKSIQRAAKALLAEKGIMTIGVQSIVNWGFPHMRQHLADIPFRALTSFPQVLTCASNRSLIDEGELLDLIAFYQSPTSHEWCGPLEATERKRGEAK